MREVVHAMLYLRGGEGDLSDIRSAISCGNRECDLPRRWRTLVRDIVKYDPMIEKGNDGVYVLRTDDAAVDV